MGPFFPSKKAFKIKACLKDSHILPDPFTTVECLFGDYFRKMIENRLNVMRATDKSIKVGKELSKMYPAFNHGQSRSSLDGCAKHVKDKMPELDRPWKIIVTKVNMTGPCVQVVGLTYAPISTLLLQVEHE